MDVLTIQWWIGGKKQGAAPPPAPAPSVVGGYVIHDYHRKIEEDEIPIIIALMELTDDD